MNADRLLARYEHIADAPDAIPRLRAFIFDLAVRGKLVPQDPNDEPASELLKRIAAEKALLVKAGEVRKEKSPPELHADELPFVVPRQWEWARLEHLAQKITDGEHLSPKKTTSGMPLLTAVHVTAKGLTLNNPQFVSVEDGHKFRLRCDPRRGDTLICSRGTIGRCAVVDVDDTFCLMGSVILVRLPSDCFSSYFSTFLSTDHAQRLMRGMSGATAVQALYLKDIRLCPIPIPPLAEQHRIVRKVDELMALCDRLEAARMAREATRDRLTAASLARLNAPDPETFRDDTRFVLDALPVLTTRPDQVKQLRETILNLAVRGKLVPQDPSDEPASDLLKHLSKEFATLVEDGVLNKPKPLKPIAHGDHLFPLPSGWALARFNQIASIQSNLVDPKRYKDMPHIAPDNIESWTGRLLPYVSIGEAGVFSGKHLFSARSILYSKIRPNLAKVTRVDFDGLCSADMYPIHALIDADFLVKFMITQYFVSQAVSEDNRVAMPKINQAALSDILVPVPPLAEQHRIVAKVDELIALCDRLEASLTTGDDTRRRLLDALLAEALAPAELVEREAAE